MEGESLIMDGKAEYKFQWSNSVNGEIIVVRGDDWEYFMLDIEKAKTEFKKPTTVSTAPTKTDTPSCQTCNAPVLGERKITWKDKQYWVRDCSSGIKHKTGFFRLAE